MEIRKAESILQQAQLLFWLSRLYLTAADLALRSRDVPTAFRRVSEVLAIAQPRGMGLVHADALVLRGRVRLLDTETDQGFRALDDAIAAIRLARDFGYVWAEREALFLEAALGPPSPELMLRSLMIVPSASTPR